jgi:hypothetical protein
MARSIGKGRDAYFAHPEGNYWKIVWSEGSKPRCGSRPPSRRPTPLSRDNFPRMRAYHAASHRSTATRPHSIFGARDRSCDHDA